MIYQVANTFVISSHRQWLPGVYDSERTARYAFKFDDATLKRLQDSVNPGGVITFEMLQSTRGANCEVG